MSKADDKSPLMTASAAVLETLRRSFRPSDHYRGRERALMGQARYERQSGKKKRFDEVHGIPPWPSIRL
jgi:hypothetical protein